MKILRVDDDVHEIITKMALADDRKITPWLNRHFREFDVTPDKMTPPEKYEAPKPSGISGAQYDSYEKPKPDLSGIFMDSPLPDPQDVIERNREQDCCQNPIRPCKHWEWDVTTGEGYRNVLSGRYKEAD